MTCDIMFLDFRVLLLTIFEHIIVCPFYQTRGIDKNRVAEHKRKMIIEPHGLCYGKRAFILFIIFLFMVF